MTFLFLNQTANMKISKAGVADVTQLVELLNSAYRGDSSKKGWTTEAHLIAGNVRTDEKTVIDVINQPGSVVLICTDEQNNIIGTVNLQKHGNKLYLGMFSVSPSFQGGGIGKKLLIAAEDHARDVDCNSIYMTVISIRTELINWYKRHGYVDTGERKPFIEDDLTGQHLQKLEFAVLEKYI
jgi:ribosomal protein S18 acetylase RimI-like enzyme